MVRKANVKPIPHKNGSVRKWPDLGSGDQSETLAEMHTLALGVESAVSSGLNLNANAPATLKSCAVQREAGSRTTSPA